MAAFQRYNVKAISSRVGKEFIRIHHYSHGVNNGPMCYGLFDDSELIGVIAFATPCSEAVCASVFGEEMKMSVTELHRLVGLDDTARNSESWFIARALRLLKKDRPKYNAVVSFADATQNHVGTIYQATNAIYCGVTGKATFYLDESGRLRHPRQNGRNITKEEANSRGWTPSKRTGKHRYLYLLPNNKKHLKELKNQLLFKSLPYPKKESI